MKAALAWLLDPYIHMFLVGLAIVWVATGVRSEDPLDAAARPTKCRICSGPHADIRDCPRYASFYSGSIRTE